MSKLYRSMKGGSPGRPLCEASARGLGVRVAIDINPSPDGLVHPQRGGMSVAPNTPFNLPQHRRPVSLGGTGRDPVFHLDAQALPETLAYRSDPRAPSQHGFVEPSGPVALDTFQRNLCQTAGLWNEMP